jgi:hypothetical protein
MKRAWVTSVNGVAGDVPLKCRPQRAEHLRKARHRERRRRHETSQARNKARIRTFQRLYYAEH